MPATKTKPAAGHKVVRMKASRRYVYKDGDSTTRRHLPKGQLVELSAKAADYLIQQKIAVEVPGATPTINSAPVPVTPITPKD